MASGSRDLPAVGMDSFCSPSSSWSTMVSSTSNAFSRSGKSASGKRKDSHNQSETICACITRDQPSRARLLLLSGSSATGFSMNHLWDSKDVQIITSNFCSMRSLHLIHRFHRHREVLSNVMTCYDRRRQSRPAALQGCQLKGAARPEGQRRESSNKQQCSASGEGPEACITRTPSTKAPRKKGHEAGHRDSQEITLS